MSPTAHAPVLTYTSGGRWRFECSAGDVPPFGCLLSSTGWAWHARHVAAVSA